MFVAKKVFSYQLFLGIVFGMCASLFLTVLFTQNNYNENNYYNKETPPPEKFQVIRSMKLIEDENVVAKGFEEEVRVLCWVMTNPNNHKSRAIHIKRTWGRRCNKILLMSSVQDDLIGTIGLPNVTEGRDWLWAKTKAAFKYVWEHHREEADWFMKADDDTFVVVENLRKFLHTQSPADPVFFGCHFSTNQIPSWASGGAGYVLSKEALRRFVEVALPSPDKCRPDHDGAEDAEMAKCLVRVGAHLGDSRDTWGRHRFLTFTPADHVYPHEKALDYWYWKDILYPQEQGLDCCANDAISFHYIQPREMYVFEYFLYHLRPYGITKEVRYVQEFPLEFTDPPSLPPTTTPSSTTLASDRKNPNSTVITNTANISKPRNSSLV